MATNRSKTKTTKTASTGTFFKWVWLTMIAGILAVAALFAIISFTMIPDTEELENPRFEVATLILDDEEDGKAEEIGRYYKVNRDWLTYEEMNPYLVEALIATEDERYHSHAGIDLPGLLRAVAFLGKRGGASTITQQLAKQFFTNYNRSFHKRLWQKLKEWAIAIEFEKRYTKEEIIAMYLNKYDFYYNAVGISSAARTYFGVDQSRLTEDQAAILIGMLKNPRIYNPKKYPENALKRRNIVLGQMYKNKYLADDEFHNLCEKPIDMANFMKVKLYDGPAPYFRAEVTKEVKKIFNSENIQKSDGTSYNLQTDGLKIYTTLDLPMQRHAEAAMVEHMRSLQERFFLRWKNMDPWTYGADAEEKKIRKNSLERKIKSTDRYRKLRYKYLGETLATLAKSVPNFSPDNLDIIRMSKEEENPGHLAEIVKKRWTTKQKAKQYKKILESEVWPELKKNWSAFRSAMTREFNTPTDMKVFAFNKQGYKRVKMSPLDSIRYHEMHLRFGSIAVDPKNGFVRTWVGGTGYDYFKYDHIRQSNNQIGSTFKPFIYTMAIKNRGMSPCQKVQDIQYSIPAGDANFGLMETWSPSNSKEFTGDFITLREGLKQSKNSVSVYLMKEIGNTEVIRNFVANLGIDKEKIPKGPSICLGSADLTVMDMAGAYTSYANNGIYTKPIFIKKIVNKDGKVIYNYKPSRRKVLDPRTNYAVVDMLKYVVAHRAGRLKSEVAGKTGTTNDHVDGWFMGITPGLVTATWVGGAERWIRFRSLSNGQGAVMARPYFEKFLTRIENDPSVTYNSSLRFEIPEGDMIELDCQKYELIAENLRAQDEQKKQEERDDEFDEEF